MVVEKLDTLSNLEIPEAYKLQHNIQNPFQKGTYDYKYVQHFCNGELIQDVSEFIATRKHFEEFGVYTKATPNSHPNSQWMKFWAEEQKRCIDGYNIGRDWIPGYLYFYWNFGRIEKVMEVEGSKKKGITVEGFPDCWDGDYFWFHYIEEAENAGKHACCLKARRKGYSYKTASMFNRNFFLIPGSKCYAIADKDEYLDKDGLITKTWSLMAWLDENTAWTKRRHVKNKDDYKRASYIKKVNGAKIEIGYKSEIMKIVLGGDPNKARGKAGKLAAWEESGDNSCLQNAWGVAQESYRQGMLSRGIMIPFGTGGCVCAGTKVWDTFGNLVNIENLTLSNGIIGYDNFNRKVSKETISYWQSPSQKLCVEVLTNTGRLLRCSIDHPILKFTNSHTQDFVSAGSLIPNQEICIIDEIPVWGTNKMWNPRLIGWLIGDGTYGYNQSVRISNCEDEINSYLETNFNITINLERPTKLGKVYKEICIKGIRPELAKLGIINQTKLNKIFPTNIHSYCKEDLKEFIGGLFDTDGYVVIRKNKRRNTYILEISISSVSLTLLEELRLLLQKFGIHGRIRKRLPRENNPKDKNPWFEYTIADIKSVKNFANNIKLFPKEKQDRLNKLKVLDIKPWRDYIGFRTEKIIKVTDIGLQIIYNLTADTTHTYIANGIITHNTEGADFKGLEDMARNPEAYDIHSVPDIYSGNINNRICYFVPDYVNSDRIFQDENGNSKTIEAAIQIDKAKRQPLKKSSKTDAYIRKCAELPFTLDEAILSMQGSPFDVALIRQVLSVLKTKSLQGEPTEFIKDAQGKIKANLNPTLIPINNFPLSSNDNNTEGCWVVYEHPKSELIPSLEGSTLEINPYRYVAGHDPIEFGSEESSDTDQHKRSLASTFIIDSFTRNIVAEYTGRPKITDHYYNSLILGLEYYNAQLLYENNLRGLYAYFLNKNKLYLLAQEPNILKERAGYKSNNRMYGFHTTPSTKGWFLDLINKWSLEEVPIDQNEVTGRVDTVPRMWLIKSIPLLQELAGWTPKLNVDRIMSLGACLLLLTDRERAIETIKTKVNSRFDDKFFRILEVRKNVKLRRNVY